MAGALMAAGALVLAVSAASDPGADGVEAQVLDDLSAILVFLDDSAASGQIVAVDPEVPGGGVRGVRLRVEAAWDLVADGTAEEACTPLDSARRQADGEGPGPDLVVGTAVAELFARLTAAAAALGCFEETGARETPTG